MKPFAEWLPPQWREAALPSFKGFDAPFHAAIVRPHKNRNLASGSETQSRKKSEEHAPTR